MVHIEEAKNYFWGLTLENEKRYTQVVTSTFHISMAALEPEHGKHKDEHVCVMLQQGDSEYLLCTLNQTRLLQQTLDLNFRDNEEITFFLNGKGRVHLTGFLVPDDEPVYESSDEEAGSSEDESDDDYIPTLQKTEDSDDESDSDEELSGGKRKKKQDHGLKKRLMLDDEAEESDDEDEEEDDDDEAEQDEDDEDIDMDLSELLEGASSDEDSDESAEDTEGSFIAKPPKKQKQEAPVKKTEETPSKKKKNKKKKGQEQQETPKPVESSDALTPGSSEKKKKKKKKKKNKENGDATPQKEAGKGKTQTGQKGRKQVLEGGVIVEDLKDGHGQTATPGRMTGVYYTGRLQNNKEFDSTRSGPPFKFRLGKKEVIKGWDVGVKGMKVGGKRRITVPAKMGYGNTKQGPIPANSTLVFDVELKSVS